MQTPIVFECHTPTLSCNRNPYTIDSDGVVRSMTGGFFSLQRMHRSNGTLYLELAPYALPVWASLVQEEAYIVRVPGGPTPWSDADPGIFMLFLRALRVDVALEDVSKCLMPLTDEETAQIASGMIFEGAILYSRWLAPFLARKHVANVAYPEAVATGGITEGQLEELVAAHSDKIRKYFFASTQGLKEEILRELQTTPAAQDAH